MNWRLITLVNAAIALVAVGAVIFDLTRPRGDHGHLGAVHKTAGSNPTDVPSPINDRQAKARIEALDNLSQARVDDLGSVPASELTHLMDRATPMKYFCSVHLTLFANSNFASAK
jgi:hypothetical protein